MIVFDNDTGVHSHFDLKLIPVQNADDLLDIYPKSAVGRTPVLIRVAAAGKLDYERIDGREIVVHVVASGAAGLSSTATLSLLLVDVNDNKPRFQAPSYRYTVC